MARSWHRAAAAAAAAAGLSALAACGSSAGHAAGAPRYQVRDAVVRGLGRILVDGGGYTLYIYQPDHQGRSVCYRVCAAQWPPLLLPRGARRPLGGRGVDPALLGTVRRTGGRLQVTYGRWPLYTYVTDIRPGQVTGQAEGMGLWYTITPAGSVDRNPLP